MPMTSQQPTKNGLGLLLGLMILLLCNTMPVLAGANDLTEIKRRGVLRHLGVPYAHFVRKTPTGYDGLDVDLMRLFADHLKVKYQFVDTTWKNIFTDLTGRKKDIQKNHYRTEQTEEIRGDIIANGLTILPWRQKLATYSTPTFPTGVWLIAKSDSSLKPIIPSGNISTDINTVKSLLNGQSVLTIDGTCLAADLYHLEQTKADIKYFTRNENDSINDLAAAMINGLADTTLLDIPDAMVTLPKWPGEIKIIGPISENQLMGVAVSKPFTELLTEFNQFFKELWNNGTYRSLVEKYYPSVFLYFDHFFDKKI